MMASNGRTAGAIATSCCTDVRHPTASCPGSLGVERAAEVFQAAVDLDGDHAVAGPEPAGDIQRGGEVRAGRRPGEDSLVAGGLAGRGERPGLGNGDDLVVVGGMQLR